MREVLDKMDEILQEVKGIRGDIRESMKRADPEKIQKMLDDRQRKMLRSLANGLPESVRPVFENLLRASDPKGG